MPMRRLFPVVIIAIAASTALAKKAPAIAPPSTQPTPQAAVGERVPSEDALLKDFHSLGLIEGHTNIFRCACPVRDIAKSMTTTQPSADVVAQARLPIQHLYDLGIRTIVSFQDVKESTKEGGTATQHDINLERAACEAVGIHFISDPISNAGPNSLETMSDQQVLDIVDKASHQILDSAATGGVMFHCSAGHDRTGIVAAYMRMKYEHWSVDEAIAEMRRYGHNWVKFSSDGGISSWHEAHLRAIAALLNAPVAQN